MFLLVLCWDWNLNIPKIYIVVTCIALLVLRPCVNHNKLCNNVFSWVEYSKGRAVAMNDSDRVVICDQFKDIGWSLMFNKSFCSYSFFGTKALRETKLIEFSLLLVSKRMREGKLIWLKFNDNTSQHYQGFLYYTSCHSLFTYIQELLVSCL